MYSPTSCLHHLVCVLSWLSLCRWGFYVVFVFLFCVSLCEYIVAAVALFHVFVCSFIYLEYLFLEFVFSCLFFVIYNCVVCNNYIFLCVLLLMSLYFSPDTVTILPIFIPPLHTPNTHTQPDNHCFFNFSASAVVVDTLWCFVPLRLPFYSLPPTHHCNAHIVTVSGFVHSTSPPTCILCLSSPQKTVPVWHKRRTCCNIAWRQFPNLMQ